MAKLSGSLAAHRPTHLSMFLHVSDWAFEILSRPACASSRVIVKAFAARSAAKIFIVRNFVNPPYVGERSTPLCGEIISGDLTGSVAFF